MKALLHEIAHCTLCLPHLPHGVNPVLSAHPKSKVVIIGQAPGSKVHQSGEAWSDKSGERLRQWLGVSEVQFYDEHLFALIPMGFCYPGKGKSGDLPPRKECAPKWHPSLLEQLQEVRLTILIGSYAQAYYLGNRKKATLTETVREFHSYMPDFIALPHPSPRNNIWLKKNPWFETALVPRLQEQVQQYVNP